MKAGADLGHAGPGLALRVHAHLVPSSQERTHKAVATVCDAAKGMRLTAELTDPGVRVMDVVQVVRRLAGLSLWRSKILATQVPAVVLTCVPEEDAAAAVSVLRDAGAQAETREQPEPYAPKR